MDLLVGNIFSFHVVESSKSRDGRYYSILSHELYEDTIYFPYGLKEGKKYKLKVETITDGKVFLDINNAIKKAYIDDQVYDFKVIGVTTKENKEGNYVSKYLEVIDKLDIKRTVIPFDWQIQGGTAAVDKVNCKVNIKGNDLYLSQVVDKGVNHPEFEVGEKYKFEVIDVKELRESTINILIVRGIDNGTYSVKAHFFQHPNNIIKQTINCIYNGIDYNGNVILEQEIDEFVNFKDIFKNFEIKDNYFDLISIYANDIFEKMQNDYLARQNLWILSFCEGIKKVIEKKLLEYDFDVISDLIKTLIYAEKWILQSGFLKTFSNEKKEQGKFVAESTISDYEFLQETVNIIKSNDYENILSEYSDKINIEIPEKDYEDTLKRLLQIIRYSPFDIVDSKYIIKLLNKLDSINLLGSNEYGLFLGVVNKRKSELRRLVITDDLPNFRSSDQLNSTYINEFAKILYLNSFILYQLNNLIKSRNVYSQYLRTLTYLSDHYEFRKRLLNLSLMLIELSAHELKKSDLKLFFETYFIPPSTQEMKIIAEKYTNSASSSNEYISVLKNSLNNGKEILVNIESVHDTFIKVKLGNNIGFVHLDMIYGFIKSDYLTNSFPVRIIKINEEAGQFIAYHSKNDLSTDLKFKEDWDGIFSSLSSDISDSLKKSVISTLENGDELVGFVKNVNNDIGVFINLGPSDALIPHELISWERNVNPSDYFTEGQVIRCKVDNVADNKITLSTQDYFADPWEKFGPKLKTGFWYVAKVVNVKEYGVFFDLAPKFFGLLHKLNIDFNEELNSIFSRGDTFCVYVSEFDCKKKRIILKDYRNVSIEDFSNKRVINLLNEQGDLDKSLYVQDKSEGYKEIVKQIAYSYRNLSFFNQSLEMKIIFLNWSRFFFSLGLASQSYLANYYIQYYTFIKSFYEMEVGAEDLEGVETLLKKIDKDDTISKVFPFIKNIVNSLEILLLYGDNSFQSLEKLLHLSYGSSITKTNQKLAKLVISNNIIDSEDVPQNFYRKNKNTIVKYLRDGVIEIGDLTDLDEVESPETARIIELIEGGESRRVEFKSSLYTPIINKETEKEIRKIEDLIADFEKQNNDKAVKSKKNEIHQLKNKDDSDDIKFSAMKTLVSFANTDGGILLIGVNDDKKIIGINTEYKGETVSEKKDNYKKLFDDTLQRFITENILACIKEVDIINVKGKDILVVEVKKSAKPVYIRKKRSGKETFKFFIRRTASVIELDSKETFEYLSNKDLV